MNTPQWSAKSVASAFRNREVSGGICFVRADDYQDLEDDLLELRRHSELRESRVKTLLEAIAGLSAVNRNLVEDIKILETERNDAIEYAAILDGQTCSSDE